MTQRPELRRMLSERRGVVAGLVAIVVVVAVIVVALALSRGSDGDDGGAGADGDPTSSASSGATEGLDSPTVTPSPGQTEPGVAETPTATPRPVRVEFGDVARLDRGVTVEVVKLESVKGKARGPGERSGPAVRFTIELTNGTSSELDLRATTVSAFLGPQRDPANQLSGPGAKQFPVSVAAGESATGVLVFRMPPGQRDEVRLDVSYRGESPTAIFNGSVR